MDEKTSAGLRNKPSPPPEVMIFGSGACAQKIAANLGDHGINTWLAASEASPPAATHHDRMHWITGIESTTCHGFTGRFQLALQRRDALLHQSATAIVVAEDSHHLPNYAPYGLEPHPRVMTISGLEVEMHGQAFMEGRFGNDSRIAFLCSWQNESHPLIVRRMLAGCRRLQHRSGVSTYFLTGNLKVAARGSETMVQEAKRSGTLFLKFTRDFPRIQRLAAGDFEIGYFDELTRAPFQFKANWIVVDEAIAPGRRLKALAQSLGIDHNQTGFAQGDNVRRLSNATNRRGIYVAGGSRGIFSDEEQLADADRASLSVLAFLQGRDTDDLPRAEIDRGRCARCLTCHRLCPHRAIEIGGRISIVTAACQGCGICMAACPARAIDMQGVKIGREIHNRARKPAAEKDAPEAIPPIVVFGCTRSAGQAWSLSRLMGNRLPEGVQFIEVPCGGSISSRHLLMAFEAGAAGVMLCTCHTDNCQAETGNRIAHRRAESARDLLTAAGIESDRLNIASLAANMGNEFYSTINTFVDRVNARKAGS